MAALEAEGILPPGPRPPFRRLLATGVLSLALHGAAIAGFAWLWEATPEPEPLAVSIRVAVVAPPGGRNETATGKPPPSTESRERTRFSTEEAMPAAEARSSTPQAEAETETAQPASSADTAAIAPTEEPPAPPVRTSKQPGDSRPELPLPPASQPARKAPPAPPQSLAALQPPQDRPVAPAPDGTARPAHAKPSSSGTESAESPAGAPGAIADNAPSRNAASAGTPPLFTGGGLDNPAPRYPWLSRRMGEEGRVVLAVTVGTQGRALDVAVRQSSGHERLDTAAADTVRGWRFHPGKRAGHAVVATVEVPLSFRLTE